MLWLSKKSETKVHWMVTVTVYGLKIIGLAPFSHPIRKSSKNSGNICIVKGFSFSKVGMVYNIVILIPLQVVTGFVISSDPILGRFEGASMLIRIILPTVSCCLTTSIILISWAFRQSNAVSVMNKILEIDRMLSGIENRHKQSGKRLVIYFLLHFIFHAIFWSIQLIWTVMCELDFWARIFELWIKALTFFIYWLIVEYSMVVGLVTKELERVNGNLSKLNEFGNDFYRKPFVKDRSEIFSMSNRGRLVSIKLLRTIRTTLYEASCDIAEFFSFPTLLSIGCFFCLFVSNILNIFTDGTLKYLSIFSVITVAYPVTLLAINVSKAMSEAELTGWMVHKLLQSTSTKKNVKSELEQFSIQLLHERHHYTAHNVFSLDCTMLQMILQATVTYLILFMQNIGDEDEKKN